MMRKTALMLATILFSATSLHADTLTDAKAILESWSPNSVEIINGGTLSVKLSRQQVADIHYTSIIYYNICWAAESGTSLDGISEIQILNESGTQGYVFDGGTELCDEIGSADLPSKAILGVTRLY